MKPPEPTPRIPLAPTPVNPKPKKASVIADLASKWSQFCQNGAAREKATFETIKNWTPPEKEVTPPDKIVADESPTSGGSGGDNSGNGRNKTTGTDQQSDDNEESPITQAETIFVKTVEKTTSNFLERNQETIVVSTIAGATGGVVAGVMLYEYSVYRDEQREKKSKEKKVEANEELSTNEELSNQESLLDQDTSNSGENASL